MGTRSYIGIRNNDKTITGIYCHWDGQVNHTGRILLEHYNTDVIVKELMKLGDLSSLQEKLNPNTNQPHNFQNQQENVCVSYWRDCGQKGTESRMFTNIEKYESQMNNSGVEFQYLFEHDDSFQFYPQRRANKSDKFQYLFENESGWRFRDGHTGVWKVLTVEDCV